MNRRITVAAAAALILAMPACAQDLAKPESLNDRGSYALGLNMARNFEAGEVPVNLDYLIRGLRDGMTGAEPWLTPEQIQATLEEFQRQLMEQQQAKRAEQSGKNQQEADAFLAKNKERQGVTTTASGLQYEVLTPGSGPKPGPADRVKVHYRGTLLDGTVFDSSYDRGQPVEFQVRGVIPGWTEALQLMPVGSKWKLFIPPNLAYGDRGAGNRIGPNAALTFEVELLEILPPAAATPNPAPGGGG